MLQKIKIVDQEVTIGPGTVSPAESSPKQTVFEEVLKAAKQASKIGAFEDVVKEDEWSSPTSAR